MVTQTGNLIGISRALVIWGLVSLALAAMAAGVVGGFTWAKSQGGEVQLTSAQEALQEKSVVTSVLPPEPIETDLPGGLYTKPILNNKDLGATATAFIFLYIRGNQEEAMRFADQNIPKESLRRLSELSPEILASLESGNGLFSGKGLYVEDTLYYGRSVVVEAAPEVEYKLYVQPLSFYGLAIFAKKNTGGEWRITRIE